MKAMTTIKTMNKNKLSVAITMALFVSTSALATSISNSSDAATIADLDGETATLHGRQQELLNRTQNLEANSSDDKKVLRQNSNSITKINGLISAHDTSHASDISTLDTKINSNYGLITEHDAEHDADMNNISVRVNKNLNTVNSTIQVNNQQNGRLATLTNKINDNKSLITEHDAEHESDLNSVRTTISEHETKHEADLNGVRTTISEHEVKHEGDLNEVRTTISEHEVKHEGDLNEVRTTISEHETKHDEQMEIIGDTLSEHVTAINVHANAINKNIGEIDATNTYLGVLPDHGEIDTQETLIKHAAQNNIHLGVDAQVGDNYPEEDPYVKTGMTALGGHSRADGDLSTAIGAEAHSNGTNSVAIGNESVANDDNTVSFGRDAIPDEIIPVPEPTDTDHLAMDLDDLDNAVEGDDEVIIPEPTIIPGKAAINRRLTHVANGINDNDVANMEQLNSTKNDIAGNTSEIARNTTGINGNNALINTHGAQHDIDMQSVRAKINSVEGKIGAVDQKASAGVAIAMASKVFLPDPGKKFRINLGVAEYEGVSAIGFTGSGRINDSTALYFGVGGDSDGDYTAVHAGASYQW